MREKAAINKKYRYEDIWFEAFETIKKDVVQNKKNLIEAIEQFQIYELEQSAKKPLSFSLNQKIGFNLKSDQAPTKRLVVKNGNYTVVPFETTFNGEMINTLIKIINDQRGQIDYIVELGSGFGRNIFLLADRLKSYQNEKQIEYFSCEYTDSGQKSCKNLLKYSHEQKIKIEYFDYKNPDLSFLPYKKNYLFFTCHSIEQIPKLKKALFDEMLNISGNCFCLHAEPVGWQYNKDLIEYRKETQAGAWKQHQTYLKRKLSKLNRNLFDRYGFSLIKPGLKFGIEFDKNDIDKPDKVSVNAAKCSLEKDYNTNLISLLKTIENDGLIKIDSERINIYGTQPFNPTTEVAWRKLKN